MAKVAKKKKKSPQLVSAKPRVNPGRPSKPVEHDRASEESKPLTIVPNLFSDSKKRARHPGA